MKKEIRDPKDYEFFMLVALAFLACAMAFILTSCSNSSLPNISQTPVQDLDLSGTLDGVPWDGIAVGADWQTHDIKIESKTDVNYFRIISCHRFEQYPDVIKTGWFRPNRGYEYTYTEAPGIEDNGLCILRLQAFTKQVDSNGQPVSSAFGLMLFHNKEFTLPVENICNGSDGQASGTSICKSMAGLVQRLKFKAQVITAQLPTDPNSPKPCVGKFIDAQTWEYSTPAGECMVVFASTDRPHKLAVHLSFGFTTSPYRGGN